MKKICLVLVALVFLGACNSPGPAAEEYSLPVLGSAAKLKSLVKTRERLYRGFELDTTSGLKEALAPAGDGTQHSNTNVQVQGIDEGDIVKTDGTYLYHIAGDKVLITRAWPATSLGIVQEIHERGFFPSTLYVDSDHLVVIGGQWAERENEGDFHILPYQAASTRVLVYDLRDKDNIRRSRDVSLDGFTVTSRKKDHLLYLVNSQYTFRTWESEEPTLPWYKDSATGEETTIGYDKICYFPDGEINDFVMFAALDLQEGQLNVETYLGMAQNIYMSHNYLYVALSQGFGDNTAIHRFKIEGTKIAYKGKGTVPGYPLNQFSMDEYQGYFRIATTLWQGETSQNNLFILDKDMKLAGELKGLAPGETIYAARFMGERGYLVTFETMDPLFAIDLSNPRAPKVLGELKIPGFSNYLHPLDAKHLLGIGQDTTLRQEGDREFVMTKGLKLAIFEVGDINKPLEKYSVVLGDSGSWSEALYDHKAVFLHDGVLALPAALTQNEGFGLEFLGALFFKLDLEKGIREIGRVTHLSGPITEEMSFWPGGEVRRVVQIEDFYYTLSDKKVMAHHKEDLGQVAEIELPDSAQIDYWR